MDVTVITPTIAGREGLLQECIQSVKDCSGDHVRDHVWRLDLNFGGPALTRNRLIRTVNSEWTAFLDDDDVLLPNHFDLHSQHTDADVIFSWGMVIHPDGGEALFDSSYNKESILAGHNTIPVTASVRTEHLFQVGGFDVNERFEDWALWKALILNGSKFKCIEEVTWHYRVQAGNRNKEE